jgi:hypothetical protein
VCFCPGHLGIPRFALINDKINYSSGHLLSATFYQISRDITEQKVVQTSILLPHNSDIFLHALDGLHRSGVGELANGGREMKNKCNGSQEDAIVLRCCYLVFAPLQSLTLKIIASFCLTRLQCRDIF